MNFLITRTDYQRILKEERELARLTGRTLTVGLLREALVQRGYEPINEGEAEPDEGGESLDLQVDRLLNGYIKSSREALQGEGRDPLRSFRRFLAEADDDDADAGEEVGDEAPPEAEAKPGTDELDVEKLVEEVVNLVQNYQNLLEVKGVVIRRAVKLLKKDFDPSVAKNFMELLRDRHNMEPGVTTSDVESQEFVAPYAAQAGPVA